MLDENIKTQIQLYKDTEKDDYFLQDLAKAQEAQDEHELFDRFYADLEFGTGGIRGIIGAGINRLNSLVVQRVAEGWANYLVSQFTTGQIKVVIAYDSRRFSDVFARVVSEVLNAHNIKVYCFTAPRPTPQLSFAIRQLQAQSGLVITASHNPPKYNGLKVYWDDGAQVIAPHDIGIMDQIEKAKAISTFSKTAIGEAKAKGLYEELTEDADKEFQHYVSTVLLQKEIFEVEDDFSVVYTPLHGTGAFHMQQLMQDYQINGIIEASQKEPNGEFPTVTYPNPEDPKALVNAIQTAKENKAQLVIANDPDADRVGLAERLGNDFVCLNGNQTGVLLLDYILQIQKENNTLPNNSAFVNTIVTTFLQDRIAESYGLEVIKSYTGFKNIAEAMAKVERDGKNFVFGCEESYGYLASMDVRDKDGISIALLCIEMAKHYFVQGKTLSDRLEELYAKHGYYQETTINKTLEGASGKEKIAAIMSQLRHNLPTTIGDEKVVKIEDYAELVVKNPQGEKLDLLKFGSASNVLIFFTESGNVLCMRPSGTEPKIKFYFLYSENVSDGIDLVQAKRIVKDKIALAENTLEEWLA